MKPWIRQQTIFKRSKCQIKGCGRKAIGEQTMMQELWGNYITIKVCDEHAYPVLRSCKSGESGHGINIGWERY